MLVFTYYSIISVPTVHDRSVKIIIIISVNVNQNPFPNRYEFFLDRRWPTEVAGPKKLLFSEKCHQDLSNGICYACVY